MPFKSRQTPAGEKPMVASLRGERQLKVAVIWSVQILSDALEGVSDGNAHSLKIGAASLPRKA